MGSIKYTVLPTEAVPSDQNSSQILKGLKVCAFCAFFGTIIFYKWPANISMMRDRLAGLNSSNSGPLTIVSITEEIKQLSTSTSKPDAGS